MGLLLQRHEQLDGHSRLLIQATYTPVVSDDLGSYLQATVIYDDAAGAGKSAEAVTAAAVTEDDDGSVTLSPTGPSVGDQVTARLTDPDGGVTGVTWTWASSPNGLSGWRDILNATSATYTPVTTDVGRYLRATATYTDAVGPGKSAEAVTSAAITADDDGSVTLSPTGLSDGDRVTANSDGPRWRGHGCHVDVGQLAQRFIRLARHIECHVSYLYSGNYGCGQISTGHGELYGRRGSGKERGIAAVVTHNRRRRWSSNSLALRAGTRCHDHRYPR